MSAKGEHTAEHMEKNREEYYVLEEKLEEVTSALRGSCDNVDCDKYIYKDLLKKRYKPVLEHGFSCFPKLKREKEALLRLLSLKKFRKFRYRTCSICKKRVDTFGENYTIASFLRPSEFSGRKAYEWKGISVHKGCKKKVKTPRGWEKRF